MRKLVKHFRFSELLKDIEAYGYQYSFSSYLKILAGGMAAFIIIGLYLRLWSSMIALLCVCYAACVPYGIRLQYRYRYEQKRFEDITTYMEYLMYSFLRNRKIIVALDDTAVLCDQKLQILIEKAMDVILYSDASHGVYQKAFRIIEEEYDCIRLTSVHTFLVQAEQKGGNPANSITLLQEDLQNWVENTYTHQKERKSMQVKVIISLILSAVVTMMMFRMLPLESGDIAVNILYQCVTTGFLAGLMLLFMLSLHAMVCSWLKDDYEPNEKKFYKDYHLCIHEKVSKRKLRYAKKRVANEVRRVYPVWLRELGLCLQTENVYNALVKSLQNCPPVLREELEKTIRTIEEEPDNMASYCTFFKDFKIEEIQSVFVMLYSLTELGSGDANQQIYAIMQRNNALMDKAAKLANEDAGFLFGIYMLTPMVLSASKLLVDMGLFMSQFMAHYSSFV